MTDQVCREPHFGRAFFLAWPGGNEDDRFSVLCFSPSFFFTTV